MVMIQIAVKRVANFPLNPRTIDNLVHLNLINLKLSQQNHY